MKNVSGVSHALERRHTPNAIFGISKLLYRRHGWPERCLWHLRTGGVVLTVATSYLISGCSVATLCDPS